MTRQTITSYLRHILPEPVQSWVSSALLQNQYIWQSLQDVEFAQRAALQCGDNPKAWSPGALALLSLGLNLPQNNQAIAPPLPLDQNTLQQAKQAYQSFDSQLSPDDDSLDTLQQAGLIALWILDRHRHHGNWKISLEDIFSNYQGSLLNWETVFACLYSLAPDPGEFLIAAIAKFDSLQGHWLVLNMLFSNPASTEDQLSLLQNLCSQSKDQIKPEWMVDWLSLQRPELAKEFSEWLLANELQPTSHEETGRIPDLLHEIQTLTWQARLYQYAGKMDDSLELLSQAENQTAWLVAELNALWAGQALNTNPDLIPPEKISSAWIKAITAAPVPEELKVNLPYVSGHLLTQIRYQTNDKKELLTTDSINEVDNVLGFPTQILLEYAQQYKTDGETDQARELAQRAFHNITSIDLIQLKSHSNLTKVLEKLCQILMDIGLEDEAALVSQKLINAQPTNNIALRLHGLASSAQGNFQSALQSFSAASLLAPDDLDLRRQLAFALDKCDEWESALYEREQIVNILSESDQGDIHSDLLALARASFLAKNFQLALDTCLKILATHPKDWEANFILGKINNSIGDQEQACHYFKSAIQAEPHQPEPWLELASIYKNNGDPLHASETISAAIQAVSDDPRLHLAYGEVLLEQNSPTQAMPSFQTAYDLAKNMPDNKNSILLKAGAKLSKLLVESGHLDKAREIIEPVFQDQPGHPEVAHIYGHVLTALKDYSGALTPLEIAIKAFPNDAQINLDYGRVLLELDSEPKIAASSLRKTLDVWPDHPEAYAFLAEALAVCGDHQTALQMFSNALNGELGNQSDWQARISMGLGQSALALGKTETALAALQEAVNIAPNNSFAQQVLSETYWSAGLQHEAWKTAQTAMRLDPTPGTALWFANSALAWSQKAAGYNENKSQVSPANSSSSLIRPDQILQEVSTTLQQTRKLYPNNTKLVVKSGQVLIQLGDFRGARTCLREILHQEQASFEDLEQAASMFMYLKSPNEATLCLEKALTMFQDPNTERQAQRLARLAEAQKQSNQPVAAVHSLEQAVSIAPHHPELYQQLVNLLISRGETDQAFSILDRAKTLIKEPSALSELQISTSILCRKIGRLAQALRYAELALNSGSNISSSKDLRSIRDTAAALYAELSWILLCPGQARGSLPGVPVPGITNSSDPFTNDLEYFCLGAELAMEFGEEIEAANYLTHALDLSPDHPWPLALQSRLLHKQKDQPLAVRTLQEAVERAGQGYYSAPVFISLANAAAKMGEWQTAVSMALQGVKHTPGEPLTQLILAQMLVQRAEFQHLCMDLNVINHAPGESCLQTESQHSFLKAIQAAETILLQAYQESISLDVSQQEANTKDLDNWKQAFNQISRWKCRGAAAFNGNFDTSDIPNTWASWTGFPLTAEDESARLAATRRANKDEKPARSLINMARENAILFPQDPISQIQASLVLSKINTTESYRYAQNAINLQSGLPKHPYTGLAHITMAQTAFIDGDLAAAEQAVEIALSIWPDEARWLNLAARIALAGPESPDDTQEKHTKVAAILEEAVRLEPSNSSHAILLSHVISQTNSHDQQTLRRALRILEKTSKLVPDDPEIWLALADTYQHAGGRTNTKLAFASGERAVIVAKEKQSRNSLIQAHITLSSIALANGEAEEGYRQARQALRIDPHNAQATILQVEALEALQRPEDALDVLDKAIPNVSGSVPLQIKRASLLSQGQDRNTGMDMLEKIIREHPDQPAAHCVLAKSLSQADKREEAIYHAQQALSKNNSAIQPLSEQDISSMHSLLGNLYNQLGHLDQAIFQFNTALQQSPGNVDAYLALAEAYQKQRQFNKAHDALEQAMNAAPSDPRPYFQAGMAYKDGRNYDQAASMLRKAAQLSPHDVHIRKQLAAVMAVVVLNNTRNLGNRLVDEAQ